ncbi:MAG: hypothetical protein ABIK86_05165, partial [candidate division WOR-3 bacterium]
VTVIDVRRHSVRSVLQAGPQPVDMVWHPSDNRVYVANYGNSSISVFRDSMTAVTEQRTPAPFLRPAPTVFRGLVNLPPANGGQESSAALWDAAGRAVLSLRDGSNYVGSLAPGVYFVERRGRFARIVITR